MRMNAVRYVTALPSVWPLLYLKAYVTQKVI